MAMDPSLLADPAKSADASTIKKIEKETFEFDFDTENNDTSEDQCDELQKAIDDIDEGGDDDEEEDDENAEREEFDVANNIAMNPLSHLQLSMGQETAPVIPSTVKPKMGTDLTRATQEEKYHSIINTSLANSGQAASQLFDVEVVDNDQIANKLESIITMRDYLLGAGIELGHIPEVSIHSNPQEINRVHEMTRIKFERERFCDIASNMVTLGAKAVEFAFDGRKTYFGRWRPDATGWSERSLPGKLQRLKPDLSSMISNFMDQYNVGSGARICIELVPNLLFHMQKNTSDAEKRRESELRRIKKKREKR